MFVRLKEIRANGRRYRYLHIVETYRDKRGPRQRIVASLGRLDELLERGSLERIVKQLVEHCPTVKLLRAREEGALEVISDRLWGPVLVFERLWKELGLDTYLRTLARGQKFKFDWPRMVFVQVLQRLLAPGSDLSGSKWIKTVEGDGLDELTLPHFYRSLPLLWDRKQAIEKYLYGRGLDLFNGDLDLVFFDTTSTYFEGMSLEGWAMRGKSKDHRPDHLQLVIAVVMRRDGLPISCEIWPGNTADMKTLQPAVQALRERFRIRKVVFVCDRGMASEENLQAIQDAGYRYIVGVKMRRLREVRDEVMGRAGRYREVNEHLQVKEVWVQKRRYVICFNPEETEKDRRDRERILEKLRGKLKGGNAKNLIPNRGYKRFLMLQKDSARIDERKIEEEARYDGKYVLRTTTDLPADEVALAYKGLAGIERLWREMKDVMEVRPVYHHWKKDNVKGHIFTCFLALYLAAALKKKLAETGLSLPWDEVIRDLSQLRAIRVRMADETYLMRSPVQGHAGRILQALGVKAPPLAQPA